MKSKNDEKNVSVKKSEVKNNSTVKKSKDLKSNVKADTVRVILNVPEEIDSAILTLAKKRGMPKSSMIIFAVSWYLDYNKSLDVLPKFFDVYSKFEGK